MTFRVLYMHTPSCREHPLLPGLSDGSVAFGLLPNKTYRFTGTRTEAEALVKEMTHFYRCCTYWIVEDEDHKE